MDSQIPKGFTLENDQAEAKKPQQADHQGIPEGFSLESQHPDIPKGFELDKPNETTENLRQLGAGLEGAAQGLVGPLAPLAEAGISKMGVPGFSLEDQAKRQEDYPGTHAGAEAATLGASMFTGLGEANLLLKAGSKLGSKVAAKLAPEAATAFARIGSSAIAGTVESMAFQSSSEMTKGLLGQGNPEMPAAYAIAGAGALGLIGGGVASSFGEAATAASKLKVVEELNMGSRMRDFLTGVGMGAGKIDQLPLSPHGDKYIKEGLEFSKQMPEYLAKTTTRTASDAILNKVPFLNKNPELRHLAAVNIGDWLSPKISSILNKTITPSMQDATTAIMMKALSTGESRGIYEALDHAKTAAQGAKRVSDVMGHLFGAEAPKAYDYAITDKDREKVDHFIEKGGTTAELQEQQGEPQGYAEGGHVSQPAMKGQNLGILMPEQSMLMAAAKGRVSNYLSSIKPNKLAQRLPYDSAPDQRQQQKKYHQAIDIAIKPLNLMKKVKDGSITIDEISHLKNMYPELMSHLSKSMVEQITKQQLKGEKINYKARQGLSLFLGTPMDSSFNPLYIQAAQAVFHQQKQQQQQMGPQQKGSTKNLPKMGQQFQTTEQASEGREIAGKS